MKESKDITLLDVINDGFETAQNNGCEGFDYTIGKVRGGKLVVSFIPDKSTFDLVEIEEFAYTLITE